MQNELIKRIPRQTHRIKFPTLLFLTIFTMLLAIHCIGNTSLIYFGGYWLDDIYLFKRLLYVLLLVKIVFFSSYRPREMLKLIAVLLIALGSALGSGDFGLFELFLLAVAAKNVEPKTIVRWFASIKGGALLITIGLWKAGVLPQLNYWNGNGYYNTLGFCHRNVLGANIAILCMCWFYLRYDRLKLWDVLAWAAIGVGFYFVAYSRSGAVIVLLVSMGVFLFRKTDRFWLGSHKTGYIAAYGLLALLGVSLWCMLSYSPYSAFWTNLDKLFTTRLKSANYCFEEYGLSLFGQEIPFVSSMEAQFQQTSKLILDNAYCRLLLYYGLVPACMFILVYMRLLTRTLQARDGALFISLMLLAVYGLSERYMLDAFYQFPMVVAFQYLNRPRAHHGFAHKTVNSGRNQ